MVVKQGRKVGAVFSVRFTNAELHAITKAARDHGMRTTQFIRRAAISASGDTSMTEGSVAMWQVE